MSTYQVLIGMNYGPDDTRVEPGDILPDGAILPTALKAAVRLGSLRAIPDVADPAETAPAAPDPFEIPVPTPSATAEAPTEAAAEPVETTTPAVDPQAPTPAPEITPEVI